MPPKKDEISRSPAAKQLCAYESQWQNKAFIIRMIEVMRVPVKVGDLLFCEELKPHHKST